MSTHKRIRAPTGARFARQILAEWTGLEPATPGVMCKYAVQVLLYKDWLQPLTILSTLPLCVGGALGALWITCADLSLPALIGMVMLFGVVTKNGILIVDYALVLERRLGLTHAQGLLRACERRARPVLMTTVAMVAGMLPMAMGWGGDGSFRQPMAVAVIGGMLASTALSLLVVPVISTFVERASARLRTLGRGGRSPHVEGGATVLAVEQRGASDVAA